MRQNEFFSEIEHRPMPWGKRTICVPVFYYDCLAMDAIYLVRHDRLMGNAAFTADAPITVLSPARPDCDLLL